MRTLKGTLKRGMMDVADFVDADGPAALLDVVSDVLAKPKMSWLDREVGLLEHTQTHTKKRMHSYFFLFRHTHE